MKQATRFLLVCILVSILFSCQNKTNIQIIGSLTEGFKLAKEQDKKVLLIVNAEGCGKCDAFLKLLLDKDFYRESIIQDFIVVSEKNNKENIPAKITRCFAYPMPFVFANNGELLAFGYPNEKGKNFSDLESIGVTKFDFLELFHSTISQDDFKKMVGKCMQAYLFMADTNKLAKNMDLAYKHAKESIGIAPFCYNLQLAYQIGEDLNKSEEELKPYLMKMKEGIEAIDRHLYSKILMNHFGLSKDEIKEIGDNKPKDVKLSIEEIDLGKIKRKKKQQFAFELTNLSQKPILIYTIRSSCTCVDLKYSKKPILPNCSCKVEGIFKSNYNGEFLRVLSVHSNSKITPLTSVALKGSVI